MAVDLTVLRPSTQSWAQDVSSADVDVLVDGETLTLRGKDAAAYLFAKSLSSVVYRYGHAFNQPIETIADYVLATASFGFPPDAPRSVSLGELADALRYKYGFDPIIEFAPGIGLRGYSLPDINNILRLVNAQLGGTFNFPMLDELTPSKYLDGKPIGLASDAIVLARIAEQSGTVLSRATEAELRQDLTEGGDVYVDRKGGFFINGVPTTAMDLTVNARLLAQDNIGSEYKVLMDEYAERNNLMAASNVLKEAITSSEGDSLLQRNMSLLATVKNLGAQYGEDDMLSVLTAQKFTSLSLSPELAKAVEELPAYFDRLDSRMVGLEELYTQAIDAANVRKARYEAQGFTVNDSQYVNNQWFKRDLVGRVDATIDKLQGWLNELREGRNTVAKLSSSLDGGFTAFERALGDTRSTSGRADVFAWLNTFDVPPNELGTIGDQDSLGVRTYHFGWFGTHLTAWSGYVADWDPNNQRAHDILLGKWPTGVDSPYGRFDWTLEDWGIHPNLDLHTVANMKQAFRDAGLTVVTNQTNPTLWHEEIYDSQNLPYIWARQVFEGRLRSLKTDPFIGSKTYYDWYLDPGKSLKHSLTTTLWNNEPDAAGYMDSGQFGFFDWNRFKQVNAAAASTYNDALFLDNDALSPSDFTEISALLNTLISNKVRDGELDQAKLQTLTAQLQNNTEAMTALIKVFKDLHAGLSQALR